MRCLQHEGKIFYFLDCGIDSIRKAFFLLLSGRRKFCFSNQEGASSGIIGRISRRVCRRCYYEERGRKIDWVSCSSVVWRRRRRRRFKNSADGQCGERERERERDPFLSLRFTLCFSRLWSGVAGAARTDSRWHCLMNSPARSVGLVMMLDQNVVCGFHASNICFPHPSPLPFWAVFWVHFPAGRKVLKHISVYDFCEFFVLICALENSTIGSEFTRRCHVEESLTLVNGLKRERAMMITFAALIWFGDSD